MSLRERKGFTLLELLLAASITALLMTAVSSVLFRHYQFSLKGQEVTEQARGIMVLTNRLQEDLRRIGFEINRSDTQDPGLDLKSNIGERVLQWDTQFMLDPVGIYGKEDVLFISRMVPAVGSQASPDAPLVHEYLVWSSRNTEHFQLPVRDATDAVQLVSAERAKAPHFLGPVSRSVVHLQESPQNLAAQHFPIDFERLRFRYFDGNTWVSEWDTVHRHALPRAVEIEIWQTGYSEPEKLVVDLQRRGVK